MFLSHCQYSIICSKKKSKTKSLKYAICRAILFFLMVNKLMKKVKGNEKWFCITLNTYSWLHRRDAVFFYICIFITLVSFMSVDHANVFSISFFSLSIDLVIFYHRTKKKTLYYMIEWERAFIFYFSFFAYFFFDFYYIVYNLSTL